MILVLLMVLGFVLDLMIISTTGGDPQVRGESLGADLVRVKGSGIWPLETWVYTLMALPGSIFLMGVYWAIRREDRDGLATIGVLVSLLTWVLSTVHNLAILAVVQGLAPAYVPGAPDAPALEASARGWLAVADALNPLSGITAVFLMVGALALGLATLRTLHLPRWTGSVSLAVVPLIGLGLLQGFSRAFIAPALIGYILYIVWNLGVSFALLKGSRPGAEGISEGAGAVKEGSTQ